MTLSPFPARLSANIQAQGPLCVGIDPSAQTLRACSLPDSAEGALAFGQRILNAGEGLLAIAKPQSAYFERFGSAGWRSLETLIVAAHAQGVLVLLDAKRGDIDSTAEAYAHAFFAPDSPTRVDAITAHAYLGFAALGRLNDFATDNGGGIFVVVRSSNPEGVPIQTARMPDGHSVAEHLASDITNYNRAHVPHGFGSIGAVVGATCADASQIVEQLPLSYILAPGVGAQGATLEDVAARFPRARDRVLPSVSRALISQGTKLAEIRTSLRALRDTAKAILT
jgi:orotidine-5'-phosphate decarboxylase